MATKNSTAPAQLREPRPEGVSGGSSSGAIRMVWKEVSGVVRAVWIQQDALADPERRPVPAAPGSV